MEKELKDLQDKTTASEEKVANLERELAVINPDQKTSLASAALQQLTTQFGRVQMERVKAESVFNALTATTSTPQWRPRWARGFPTTSKN